QFRIIGDRCIDVLVSKKLGDRSEGPGTVLLHQTSGEMPELVRGHSNADPIRQYRPYLLRQPVWALVPRSDRKQIGVAGCCEYRAETAYKSVYESRRTSGKLVDER